MPSDLDTQAIPWAKAEVRCSRRATVSRFEVILTWKIQLSRVDHVSAVVGIDIVDFKYCQMKYVFY